MRNRFDADMDKLHAMMTGMGALCESAIACAVKALWENDKENAQRAVALEDEINEREREIEALCMKLLLRQQPVARDFRKVSSALKMITDLERIGDQAEDIAEIALLGNLTACEKNPSIREMTLAVIGMVTDAVSAYVNQDIQLAHKVIDADDVVDALFDRVKGEMAQLLAEDPAEAESVIDLLMAAKYLERIGDHAVNLGEWVIYAVTGTHYKDMPHPTPE